MLKFALNFIDQNPLFSAFNFFFLCVKCNLYALKEGTPSLHEIRVLQFYNWITSILNKLDNLIVVYEIYSIFQYECALSNTAL